MRWLSQHEGGNGIGMTEVSRREESPHLPHPHTDLRDEHRQEVGVSALSQDGEQIDLYFLSTRKKKKNQPTNKIQVKHIKHFSKICIVPIFMC